MTDPSPWWDRDSYADRRPFLLARGRILSALRDWFRKRGFLEVETPALQVSPGNEIHLHAFATELAAPGGERTPLLSAHLAGVRLQEAPGRRRSQDLQPRPRVPQSRARAAAPPEFTMLEWYRTNEPYEALMADCAAILVEAAKAAGSLQMQWKDRTADPYAAPERLTVADAFQQFAGIDLLATLDGDEGDRDKLAAAAHAAGVQIADDDTWSDIFSRVLVERIEPRLGTAGRPCSTNIRCRRRRWAQRADDPRLAQRFELYACGVELANGFAEITDAAEQRRRFEDAMAEKQRRYGERYPIDDDFLAALANMPPASGIALGFDRLVMLATGATRIEQVLWAPVAGDDR